MQYQKFLFCYFCSFFFYLFIYLFIYLLLFFTLFCSEISVFLGLQKDP